MRKSWLWTPVALIVAAALSYGLFVYLRPPPLPAGFLYGSGHIEGTEINVSAEVSARVVESNLVEGRTIEASALLVRLDDAELKAQLGEARAQETAVNSTLASLEAQRRTWEHHLQTARADVERFRALSKTGKVSEQQLDKAENQNQEARGRLDALAAQLKETKARMAAMAQRVRQLELQLAKTEVRAPISGTVLIKGIEPGELTTPGKVVAVLVDLNRLELKVYVPERDIGKVKLSAPARVRVDAFPDRYFEATVARVDQRAQFTPRDIHLPEERVRMVFGVTLTLSNEGGFLKPGMPADAWIRWDSEARWPGRLVVPG